MPSQNRFPTARARRPHRRLALFGGVVALVALVAVPVVARLDGSPVPAGDVAGVATVEQEPVAAAGTSPALGVLPARPSAVPTPTTEPSATPAGSPAPIDTPPTTAAATPPPAASEIDGADWQEARPRLVFGRPRPAPPIDTLRGYTWPLAHPRLTLPFGPTPWGTRLVNGKLFHDGVDLATFCGDHVTAAHAGKVLAAGRHFDVFMGWIGDLGPYTRRLDVMHIWSELPIVVVVDDGNGYRSMYAHFATVVVKKGQQVRAGQLLGYEGRTGRASGCHLHYGLFSPLETKTFALLPDVAKRMRLPAAEIARVDPLKILPPKHGINERKAPKKPKASPGPSPTASPTS